MTSTARGDGGTARFARDLGDYHVTVFTAPTPLRAGPVDVSVLLQDRQTGQFVTDVDVAVRVAPTARPTMENRYAATSAAATNKLLQAALCEIPRSGTWTIGVELSGDSGGRECQFDVNVAEPLPRWVEFIFWIGLPLVPITLFTARETIRGRATERPTPGRLHRRLE